MLPLVSCVVLLSPVTVTVEASRPTAGGNIRQFAFDGDPATAYVSAGDAKKDDHVTLRFDRVVDVRSLAVSTGRPGEGDDLVAGVLEVSADGTAYEPVAKFQTGEAKDATPRKVRAVRVRATADLPHALSIREFTIDARAGVAAFPYPVEIALDVADAPDLRPWAESAVRVCERQYPMICRELASEGYKPPTQIRMAFKADYKGVAEAAGPRVRASVKWFTDHPDDVGALVHETAHCVQAYRRRGLPGWLVEGIADYVRFWKYEPGKAGRLSPERARYDGSYRTTAAFLAYVSDTYDVKAVTKLNALLRDGKYESAVWKELTGKSLEELGQEWRRSLVR